MLLFTQDITIRGLLLSAVPLFLHYLPRCLCSTVTYRAPVQIAHHNKPVLSYNENRAVDSGSGGPVVPSPHLKYVPPISCLVPRLLYTSNIAFKKCCPLWVLIPTAAKSWRRVWIKTHKISVTNKKYECAYFIWNDIIEYWFNYSPSFKVPSATKTSTFRRTFLLHKTFFITLVTHAIDDISH